MSNRALTNALLATARHTPLSRGFGRRVTLRILKKIHPEPIQSRFRGVPFLFHLDNNTEKKALMSDGYDRLELDFLAHEMAGRPCVFLDIGANSGLYSLFLASSLAQGSRVLAIEPNPRLCERIKANIELLRRDGLAQGVQIDVEACAAGDEEGRLYLDVGRGPGVAGIVSGDTPGCISVPAKKLITICQEHSVDRIDAMKIDVEGYEDRVLLPFLEQVPESHLPRALLFEFTHGHGWQADLILACANAGYREAGRTRSCLLFRKPD